MKRLFFLSITITFFSILLNSCKKDRNVIVTPQSVTAKWRWIYTYYDAPLSATNPLTPVNTGNTEGMEYTANNQWRKFYNTVAIDSGTYTLEHNTYTNPSNTTFNYDEITYNRNNSYLGADYYEIKGDTLIFCPCYRDFFTSLNVRNIGGSKWFVKQ